MTAKELKEKYESDLKQLQNTCTHAQVSVWLKEQWAPAHGTGREVKICEICWSTVESRKDPDWEILSA